MSESQSFAELVGLNARRIRQEQGATLEQVSTIARSYGLKWSTARVVELERGRLAIGAPLLFVLAQTLGDAGAQRVELSDLVQGAIWVQLNREIIVSSEALRRAVSGAAVDWTAQDVKGGVEELDGIMSRELAELSRSAPSDTNARDLRAATAAPKGLAEERIGRKLGISTTAVTLHALKLWGKSLTEYRDELAGHDATAQKRGQVTRRLLAEIRANIPPEGKADG